MKEYPSISRSTGQSFQEIKYAYVFDKLDGSSMRSEWSKKRGWYKHGKRHGLVDSSDQFLSEVPSLFNNILAEPIERVAVDNKWENLIVFYEYWGNQSIAGRHVEGDPKYLSLFDAAVNKKGILGPAEFLFLFGTKVPIAKFLGKFNWNRSFVESIRLNNLPGVTFEGVVGKAGEGHHIVRAKAKTQQWIDKVKELYGLAAEAIINS
jgi:hypothetical protein